MLAYSSGSPKGPSQPYFGVAASAMTAEAQKPHASRVTGIIDCNPKTHATRSGSDIKNNSGITLACSLVPMSYSKATNGKGLVPSGIRP
jgi:hypothetical protein